MRTIKFRGKLVFSPGWIVGGYCQWSDIKDNKKHQIISSVGFHNDVKPETVGQFTGLYDKNGEEIYEGDIIQFNKVQNPLKKVKGVVEFDVEIGGWMLKDTTKMLSEVLFEQNNDEWKAEHGWAVRNNQYATVIGNIHENPELI
ncbi:MAG: YopX family protein [Edaphocola sp.]